MLALSCLMVFLALNFLFLIFTCYDRLDKQKPKTAGFICHAIVTMVCIFFSIYFAFEAGAASNYKPVCEQCGNYIRNGYEYCPKCGNYLEGDSKCE